MNNPFWRQMLEIVLFAAALYAVMIGLYWWFQG